MDSDDQIDFDMCSDSSIEVLADPESEHSWTEVELGMSLQLTSEEEPEETAELDESVAPATLEVEVETAPAALTVNSAGVAEPFDDGPPPLPLIRSVAVQPQQAGESWFARPADQQQQSRPRHSGPRYSRIVPWSNLPGVVRLSSPLRRGIADKAKSTIAWLTDHNVVVIKPAVFVEIVTAVRRWQTDGFNDIEKRLGRRGTPAVETQRYRLKAFFGPLLDILRETEQGWARLPNPIKNSKIRSITRLLNRLSVMHRYIE